MRHCWQRVVYWLAVGRGGAAAAGGAVVAENGRSCAALIMSRRPYRRPFAVVCSMPLARVFIPARPSESSQRKNTTPTGLGMRLSEDRHLAICD